MYERLMNREKYPKRYFCLSEVKKVTSCFYQIFNPEVLLTYLLGFTAYKNYINCDSENQAC